MIIQSWIIIGLIAGGLVGIMMGRSYGIVGDIILGIIGGLVGGSLASILFVASGAVNGAAILLTMKRVVARPSGLSA